jgi:hypothetical protein
MRRALALLLLTASPAGAFEEDFEEGDLSQLATPPGVSVLLNRPEPGVTMALDGRAAHRGDGGLRVTDTSMTSVNGPGGQAWVSWTFASPIAPTSYYQRGWFRVIPANNDGGFAIFSLLYPFAVAGLPPAQPIAGLGLSLPSGTTLGNGGLDPTAHWVDDAVWTVPLGDWHLFEAGVTGFGLADGGRRVWFDGKSVSVVGENWQGAQIGIVVAGETFSFDGAFTGTIDIDDMRTSFEPPASTLRTFVPPGAGECVPVVAALEDSDGRPAPAPYDVAVSIQATAPAQLFSDAQCTAPVRALALPATFSQAQGWLSSQKGVDGTVQASHPDFISDPPAPFQLVGRDTGYAANLGGCRCDSRQNGAAALALLCFAAARRRRARV